MATIQAIKGISAIETLKIINKTSADNEGDRTYSGFNFNIDISEISGSETFLHLHQNELNIVLLMQQLKH